MKAVEGLNHRQTVDHKNSLWMRCFLKMNNRLHRILQVFLNGLQKSTFLVKKRLALLNMVY